MSNPLDRRAVILAEQIAIGLNGASEQLRRVIQTVGLSSEAHQHIRATLGERGYRQVCFS